MTVTVFQPMWVYDMEQGKLVHREISYVPGLYKIFDEILVNAADNKQRDKKMSEIRVSIDKWVPTSCPLCFAPSAN